MGKGLKELLKKNALIHTFGHYLQEVKFKAATIISPRLNTKMRYKTVFGKELDLDNPQTLNEKILWLKLNVYMKHPLIIQCADKYRVREFVKKQNCEDILINLLGVYDKAEDIDWDSLPDKFVLKWNFGAGMNFICSDKSLFDKGEVLEQLRVWGKNRFWLTFSEMQYKYCKKRIVCEELIDTRSISDIENGKWVAPEDYKVYCFHGEPKYIMVCMGREQGHPKFYFFTTKWELARINPDTINAPTDFHVDEPVCLDKLLDCARKLSKPFPFVRADFYVVGEKVYFGELTFTPACGLDANRLPETDLMFGKLVDLKRIDF